jgi:hypothetical protein
MRCVQYGVLMICKYGVRRSFKLFSYIWRIDLYSRLECVFGYADGKTEHQRGRNLPAIH